MTGVSAVSCRYFLVVHMNRVQYLDAQKLIFLRMGSNAIILAPAMLVVGDRSDSSVLDNCYTCGRESMQGQNSAYGLLKPSAKQHLNKQDGRANH